MHKKFLTVFSFLLLLTVFLSACGQKDVNGPTPASSQKETTTEKEKTTKPAETILETSTEIVSDPTRKSSQKARISTPSKIIFYSDGKNQTLTKETNRDVVEEINEAVREDRWDILKLVVSESDIENIKKNNYCIELYYNEPQTLDGINTGYDTNQTGPFNFEKMLIVLNGEHKNVIFFEENGKFQNGPISPYKSDLSQDILDDILDD